MSASLRAAAGERPRSRAVLGHFAGRSITGLFALILATLVGAGLLYLASGLVLAVDRAVADGLNDLVAPSPATVAVLQALALPGESVVGWVVLGTLALYLLLRRQVRLAAFVAVTGLGAAALGPSIKELVGRVRPIVDAPVAGAPGPSFPSGHTLTVTVVVGVLLLVLLPTAPPRARRPLIGVGVALIAVVAFTRVALGVHFLSDVVGGAAVGTGWVLVTASALRSWRRELGLGVPPVERGLEPEAAADLVPSPDPEPTPVDGWTVAARTAVTAVLLLGVALAAGLLVTRVLPGTGIGDADADLVRWLVTSRTPELDALSGPAAELGNTAVIMGGGAVVAVLAVAVWRRWRPALLITVLLLGELAIFLTAATVIGRPRPPVAPLDAELPPTSSFPSGHTSAAICLYGAIAALVFLATRAWWRWLVLALAVTAVVAVALARLYRGAHFPTDVLGSVLFAVPWLLVMLRLLPAERA
jgi:membrane-associated phospholipid phosphatase